jgi:hypothetical protein
MSLALAVFSVGLTCDGKGPDLHEQNAHWRVVGLEEIDDGIWSLYYGPILLARLDEREMKFYG